MRKATATHSSAVEVERVIHGLFRRFPSPAVRFSWALGVFPFASKHDAKRRRPVTEAGQPFFSSHAISYQWQRDRKSHLSLKSRG